MSEKLLIQDIQRVQSRITRIRKRAGTHALQIAEIPAIHTLKSYQSMGQSWFAAKPAQQPTQQTGWWSLLVVIAGWYFSQPEAAHKLWDKLMAYWHAWKDSDNSSTEEEVDRDTDESEST